MADLNFTEEEKCNAILKWAKAERVDFKTNFVESLQGQLLSKGSLSPKQIKALDTIIVKFGINITTWC